MDESLQFIDFQPNETVASIGCGGGLWEIAMSFSCENVHFYLQDINAQLLNTTELNNSVSYFEKQYKKPNSCNFQITIGEPFSTKLPTNYFDKVVLLNSLHEFDQPESMLLDCQRILKPKGELIIEEEMATFPNQLHDGCGKKLYAEATLIDLLKAFNIHLVKKQNFGKKLMLKFSVNF
jgi:ubiquinone/menaquinone biosynthesis C-methylase UbiE